MTDAFKLAWRTLLRGRFLPLLLIGVAAVIVLMPGLIRTDGTDSGARELYIHSVLGCAAVLVFISILCASCGHLARSREMNRLALSLVRPVGAFGAMIGVWCAYLAAAAAAMSVAAVAVYFRAPGGEQRCCHNIAPVMPSPMSVAAATIDEFLARPSIPDAVRKAPRKSVLAYLAAGEMDRYDSIPPGAEIRWNFPAELAMASDLTLRAHFATPFAMRAAFAGEFAFGDMRAVVSNDTQSVLDVKLAKGCAGKEVVAAQGSVVPLSFKNTGAETVMLRPRQDLLILAPADSFGANLSRAVLHSLAGVALAAAFGIFLSSALSRPVAVFTAFVSVAVICIAPSVIEQFPDGAGLSLGDRVGLALSRGVYAATSSFSDAAPIADLAEGKCVEWPDLARVVALDALIIPAVFLGLAAFTVRRKALPLND